MNLTHTAVLTVAFVLRLKPQGEGVRQILFPKLKLGANYFMSLVRCIPAEAGILSEFQGFIIDFKWFHTLSPALLLTIWFYICQQAELK